MQLGIIVNDIQTEQGDFTTTHLAMAATNLGHEVWYMGVADLDYEPDEKAHGYARRVADKKYRSAYTYLASLNGKNAQAERISIDELDVLLLRNDPADDINTRHWARLAGINFARLAMRHGLIVLNDPNGLTHAINKMYLQTFPREIRPRTLITRNREEIKHFIAEQNGWGVLKPLAGSGGRNVFLVNPQSGANLNQMIDAVATEGYIIVQEYLPEVEKGDTRMFLMNALPLKCRGHYAAFHRVRYSGDSDFRSNMTAGACAVKAIVTDEMLRLAEQVRPRLVQDGMFLVGLDIIGNKLMEINVFSPGGLDSLEKLEGVPFMQSVIQAIEHKVEYRRKNPEDVNNIEIATY
ncbi:MAG: glutathione synthetase [Gammaproteobacteria bacterium]